MLWEKIQCYRAWSVKCKGYLVDLGNPMVEAWHKNVDKISTKMTEFLLYSDELILVKKARPYMVK